MDNEQKGVGGKVIFAVVILIILGLGIYTLRSESVGVIPAIKTPVIKSEGEGVAVQVVEDVQAISAKSFLTLVAKDYSYSQPITSSAVGIDFRVKKGQT